MLNQPTEVGIIGIICSAAARKLKLNIIQEAKLFTKFCQVA